MTSSKRDKPESFTDVINLIQSDLTLSATKRRDCVSALKSLARMLDLDPSQIPANTDWLRQRLKSFHPKQARISDKRYANIRSCVTFIAFDRIVDACKAPFSLTSNIFFVNSSHTETVTIFDQATHFQKSINRAYVDYLTAIASEDNWVTGAFD